MPYIIDGNNLIGAIPLIDIRDPQAREKLTSLLSRYHKAKGNAVTVVYDGPPPDGAPQDMFLGRLRIIYAGPESDADTRIKQMVRSSRHPEEIIVVSSDKQVYSYCTSAGASAMRVMPFFNDVKATLEALNDDMSTKPLSAEEVDEWLEYFGLDDD